MRFLALAGASGSGKSTLARATQAILGTERCAVLSTSQILRERFPALAGDRAALKAEGDRLDHDEPDWFLRRAEFADPDTLVIVDAVRSLAQLLALQDRGVTKLLTRGTVPEFDPEQFLGPVHSVPAGEFCKEPRTLALAVLEGTRWFDQGCDGVIGAQWGSEGKGKVCCSIVSRYAPGHFSAFARAGGPNAGHRVQLPDPEAYGQEYVVLRHLPSATPLARPGTVLAIGPGAVVDLKVLASELRFIPEGARLVVDPAAVIVTRGAHAMEQDHDVASLGSTRTGTGGAQALRALRAAPTFGDLETPEGFRRVVDQTLDVESAARVKDKVYIEPVGRVLREAKFRGRVLFEGTQGMQLSIYHGAYPHVTGRDISPAGLLSELGLPPDTRVKWHVVARTYPIRVGGPSGPMPGETDWEEVARTSGRDADDLRGKERTSVTNRLRRVARWQRGALFETVTRALGADKHGCATIWITFADYLSRDQAKLAEIVEEAKACSGEVYLGTGPGTNDWDVA